jgi:hypothetical protein
MLALWVPLRGLPRSGRTSACPMWSFQIADNRTLSQLHSKCVASLDISSLPRHRSVLQGIFAGTNRSEVAFSDAQIWLDTESVCERDDPGWGAKINSALDKVVLQSLFVDGYDEYSSFTLTDRLHFNESPVTKRVAALSF